jgi:hypothetical protein
MCGTVIVHNGQKNSQTRAALISVPIQANYDENI